ncbi:MAG: alpha-N-acetylglucosaminidase TIM-barrel domain-containing protein, partial [Candidatus Margulisiibacteriota bacterium]
MCGDKIKIKYALAVMMLTLAVVGLRNYAIAEVMIVDKRVPHAAIVISEKPSPLESQAAGELSRYIKEMTGVSIPVFTEKDKDVKDRTNLILLGSPETNLLIRSLAGAKLLKLSTDFPGLDGFVIKTITVDRKNYLILGGSTDRGTLYAVYHFLENVCRVGFFWDGDRVPSMEVLSVSGIDIVEKPYFPERCAMVPSYAWAYWNTADWKREVDWLARKKFNMSWGLVRRPAFEHITLHEVFSDLGIKGTERERVELARDLGVVIDDLNELKQYQVKMAREVLDYVRSWGLEPVYEAFSGDIPEEFIEKYPKVRHFKKLDETSFVYGRLHPADPLFAEIGSAYIKKQHQMFGPGHFYYISPYPEESPGATREEKDELQINFAKSTVNGIKTADPKGKWLCSGWAFTADRVTWDNRALKTFLDAIPNDMFLVWDVWAEMHPMYKWTDYFFGKDWAFGVIHCFGGNVSIFGNVKDLIRRVQEVASDPKAKNCKQFFLSPEGITYNSMYFDLATKLAWDPKKVNLETYLPDFADRRYGEESSANMVKCWQELIESVHSTNRYNDQFYHLWLAPFPNNT